jgi:hypothetical protein
VRGMLPYLSLLSTVSPRFSNYLTTSIFPPAAATMRGFLSL